MSLNKCPVERRLAARGQLGITAAASRRLTPLDRFESIDDKLAEVDAILTEETRTRGRIDVAAIVLADMEGRPTNDAERAETLLLCDWTEGDVSATVDRLRSQQNQRAVMQELGELRAAVEANTLLIAHLL